MNDNKPAFPTPYIPGQDAVDDQPAKEGMSLREWYAGLAMQAHISNSQWYQAAFALTKGNDDVLQDVIAEQSFVIADKMIIESQKEKQQ